MYEFGICIIVYYNQKILATADSVINIPDINVTTSRIFLYTLNENEYIHNSQLYFC